MGHVLQLPTRCCDCLVAYSCVHSAPPSTRIRCLPATWSGLGSRLGYGQCLAVCRGGSGGADDARGRSRHVDGYALTNCARPTLGRGRMVGIVPHSSFSACILTSPLALPAPSSRPSPSLRFVLALCTVLPTGIALFAILLGGGCIVLFYMTLLWPEEYNTSETQLLVKGLPVQYYKGETGWVPSPSQLLLKR